MLQTIEKVFRQVAIAITPVDVLTALRQFDCRDTTLADVKDALGELASKSVIRKDKPGRWRSLTANKSESAPELFWREAGKKAAWSKDEFELMLAVYPLVKEQLHERNPYIQRVAFDLRRRVRTVERQLLMFRAKEKENSGEVYSNRNRNTLVDECWNRREEIWGQGVEKYRGMLDDTDVSDHDWDDSFMAPVRSGPSLQESKTNGPDSLLCWFAQAAVACDIHSPRIRVGLLAMSFL